MIRLIGINELFHLGDLCCFTDMYEYNTGVFLEEANYLITAVPERSIIELDAHRLHHGHQTASDIILSDLVCLLDVAHDLERFFYQIDRRHILGRCILGAELHELVFTRLRFAVDDNNKTFHLSLSFLIL